MSYVSLIRGADIIHSIIVCGDKWSLSLKLKRRRGDRHILAHTFSTRWIVRNLSIIFFAFPQPSQNNPVRAKNFLTFYTIWFFLMVVYVIFATLTNSLLYCIFQFSLNLQHEFKYCYSRLVLLRVYYSIPELLGIMCPWSCIESKLIKTKTKKK